MSTVIKPCWQIKGCPASFYLNCEAYAKQKNCWEIEIGCQCDSTGKCNKKCAIYKAHLLEENSESDISSD